jgi:hypothetical protein
MGNLPGEGLILYPLSPFHLQDGTIVLWQWAYFIVRRTSEMIPASQHLDSAQNSKILDTKDTDVDKIAGEATSNLHLPLISAPEAGV